MATRKSVLWKVSIPVRPGLCRAFRRGAAGGAQFRDPRNYQNFPVGVNQIEMAYMYVRADAVD